VEKKPWRNRHKNYTHHQLLDQLDRYAARAKTKEQRDEILKRKEKYKKHHDRKHINEASRPVNFKAGQDIGLHAHITPYEMHQQELDIEQSKRNSIAREARKFYHKNYSASKDFSKKKGNVVKNVKPLKVEKPMPKRGKEKQVTKRFQWAAQKRKTNYQLNPTRRAEPQRARERPKDVDRTL